MSLEKQLENPVCKSTYQTTKGHSPNSLFASARLKTDVELSGLPLITSVNQQINFFRRKRYEKMSPRKPPSHSLTTVHQTLKQCQNRFYMRCSHPKIGTQRTWKQGLTLLLPTTSGSNNAYQQDSRLVFLALSPQPARRYHSLEIRGGVISPPVWQLQDSD